MEQHTVEPGDLPPIGVGGRACLGVHRGNRGLERVGTEPPRAERAGQPRRAFGNLIAVPAAAVLRVEQHELAGRRCPCRPTRLLQQHERQKSLGLGVRQQVDQQSPEAKGFARERVVGHRGAGRRRIALVEHEVDDVEHRVEPLRKLRSLGHLIRKARVANLRLGANDPLRDGGGAHEKGPRDFLGGEPAHFTQRERDAGIRRERGMAAREDQAQPIVLDRGRVFGRRMVDARLELRGQRDQRAIESPPSAQGVDGFEAARGHEPRHRIGRHALRGPLLDGRDERVVQRLLGQVEVPEEANEGGEHAPRVGAIDGLDECLHRPS